MTDTRRRHVRANSPHPGRTPTHIYTERPEVSLDSMHRQNVRDVVLHTHDHMRTRFARLRSVDVRPTTLSQRGMMRKHWVGSLWGSAIFDRFYASEHCSEPARGNQRDVH